MLSRVAENIYWMARNVERAENIARIAEVNHHLSLDSLADQRRQWDAIIAICGDEEAFYQRYQTASQASVLSYLTTDRNNPNSILQCLGIARENARGTRDQLSHEVWQHLNLLFLRCKDFAQTNAVPHQELFEEIRNGSHLFFGLLADTMTHDEAYHWANVGRFLERAEKTSRVIDVKYFILLPNPSYVGTELDAIQWLAVLKSVSAAHMYLRHDRSLEPEKLISFLLKHDQFPRSIAWCLRQARHEFLQIAEETDNAREVLDLFDRLNTSVSMSPIREILQNGLHEFIDNLQREINNLHGRLQELYFTLPVGSHDQSQ